jgi:hypothetical protein
VDRETGDLYVGAHPSVYAFFAHSEDIAHNKSPSQASLLCFAV